MSKGKGTTAKGLGWKHQQIRRRLLAQLRDGDPCWWCGKPMYRVQPLAADHGRARANGGTEADRLLHDLCNKARGKGDRDHLRPALAKQDHAALNVLDW